MNKDKKYLKNKFHNKGNSEMNKDKDYYIILNFWRDLPFIPNINNKIKTN